jgi:hypothetical protein
MKKLYLVIGFVLTCIQAFPSASIYTYSTGTWTLLILFGVILVATLAYLFIHASIEYYLRDKEINKYNDPEESEKNNDDLKELEAGKAKISEELINLFMLKRKGVINEKEYHQLKERLLKKKMV